MIVNEYELRDAIRAIHYRRRQEPDRKMEVCYAGAVHEDGRPGLQLEHNARTHEYRITVPRKGRWWLPYVVGGLAVTCAVAVVIGVLGIAYVMTGIVA